MDGHTAERFFTAAGIRDDESVRNRLFWRGRTCGREHRSLLPVISLIGMAAGIPQNMLLKIFGHIDWHYAHNLYTGMEKGLGQPA